MRKGDDDDDDGWSHVCCLDDYCLAIMGGWHVRRIPTKTVVEVVSWWNVTRRQRC